MHNDLQAMVGTNSKGPKALKMDGVFNFRDLGGYPTMNGGTVRENLLFRSDDLWRLSDSDLGQLHKLSIRTVIDLRTDNEADTRGRFPVERYSVNYNHVSLADISADNQKAIGNPNYLVDRYKEILTSSPGNFAKVISILANQTSLPAVFHCAVGKDRTGLVAAVTLGLLGVEDQDIVSDYAESQQAMDRTLEWLGAEHPDLAAMLLSLPPIILSAPSSAMEGTINWIREEFGNFEGYAKFAGVPSSEISDLRSRLIA